MPRPSFHLSTGSATLNGSARARSCAASGSGGDGLIDSMTTAQIPLATRAGFSTVYVNLSLSFVVNLSITAGKCTLNRSASLTDCETSAAYNLSISAGVVDTTAGSYVGFAGSWTDWVGIQDISACYLGSCSSSNSSINGGSPGLSRFSASPSWVERLSPNMVQGHRYALVASIEAQAIADVWCLQAKLVGAKAAASLDLASAGNGLTLSSIVEI